MIFLDTKKLDPCYPPFITENVYLSKGRNDYDDIQRLDIADFVSQIMPKPIRIATIGITTAGAPIVEIALERK